MECGTRQVALQGIELPIGYGGPIVCIRAVAVPEGPQWARCRAQLDLVGAAVAARQAMPAHRLEWCGMAELGLDLVHVLGHVLRLRLGLSKTQNKESSGPISAWAVCEGARFSAEGMLGGLSLLSGRQAGHVLGIFMPDDWRFEMPAEGAGRFRCGGMIAGFVKPTDNQDLPPSTVWWIVAVWLATSVRSFSWSTKVCR